MNITAQLNARNAKAFTLIEVSINVVIAALVLAGVLKGNSVIASAHGKRLSADIAAITSAYLTYRDRYGAIPGDDNGAAARWAGVSNGTGDGVLSGRYDDDVPSEVSSFTIDMRQFESLNFWAHLRAAHLVSGPDAGIEAAARPAHALGGHIGVQQGGFGLQGPVMCVDNIEQEMAAALDRAMDDGNPATGSLRAGTAGVAQSDYANNAGDVVVCVSLDGARGGIAGPLYSKPL